MTRLCYKCNKMKKDATGYVLKSIELEHTYLSFDLCLDCRDRISDFILATQQEDAGDKIPIAIYKCTRCGTVYTSDNINFNCCS